MNNFSRKTAFVISVAAFVLIVSIAIVLPALASSTDDVFVGCGVKLDGTVGLDFEYSSLGDADAVHIIVKDSNGEPRSDDPTVVDISDIEKNSDGNYIVSVKLAAAQMTDNVTVYTVKNGVQHGKQHTYTVRGCALDTLASDEYKEYHSALRAMLNYGAMAQSHFDVNEDDLANSGLYKDGTNPVSGLNTVSCDEVVLNDGDNITMDGYEAVLESATAFRIYFRYDGDINKLSATVSGEELETSPAEIHKTGASGRYYVRIDNISAAVYDFQYTVTVSDGSDTMSIKASILNYVNSVLKSGETSNTQKQAARAMYNYYVFASDSAPDMLECTHSRTYKVSGNNGESTITVCSACDHGIKTVADNVELFRSPQDLAYEYSEKTPTWEQKSEILTDSDGTVFVRLYGGSALGSSVGYQSLYVRDDNGDETGRYFVLRYRLPSTNKTAQPALNIYSKTVGNGEWNSSTYVGISTRQDGQWHTIVIDLAARSSYFKPSGDGRYYAESVWVRPVSASGCGTAEDHMDVAYAAICNDMSDLAGVIDEESYDMYVTSSTYGAVRTADNQCLGSHFITVNETAKECTYVCAICGKSDYVSYNITGANIYQNAYELVTYPNNTEAHAASKHFAFTPSLEEENGLVYARFLINGNGGAGHIYAHGGAPSKPATLKGGTGQYLVMKVRSSGNIGYVLELGSGAGVYSASAMRYVRADNLNIDNVWQTVVIDLSTYANYKTNTSGSLVFRMTSTGGSVGTDTIDIAYFAIVDGLAEAKKILGDEETYRYYSNGASWNSHGELKNTADIPDGRCSYGCTPVTNMNSGTDGDTVYTFVCSVCGYKISEKTVGGEVNWHHMPASIYEHNSSGGVMADNDGTVFTRVFGGTNEGEETSYNSILFQNIGKVTGQYLVIKYRLRDDNPTSFPVQHVYVSAGGGSWGLVEYVTHQDGMWHTVVLDLAEYVPNNFKPEDDGTYKSTGFWLRPVTIGNKSSTKNDYIDYAFVGSVDSIDDLGGIVDDDIYELHTAKNVYSNKFVTKADGCSHADYRESGSDNSYVYTCIACGATATFDVDRYFGPESIRTQEAFQINTSILYDKNEGEMYMHLAGKGMAGQLNAFRRPISYTNNADGSQSVNNIGRGTPFNVGKGDKYLVVKYRTNSTSWQQYLILGVKDANTVAINPATNKYEGASNHLELKLPMNAFKTDEWQILVIDMAATLGSDRWIANSAGEYTVETLQFHSNNIPVGTYYDIAYYAIVDSVEDIASLTGARQGICINSESGDYKRMSFTDDCADGECIIADKVEGDVYKQYCSACGKIYDQHDIKDVNAFVSAGEISGFTNLYFPNVGNNKTPPLVYEYDEDTGNYILYANHVYSHNAVEGWIYVFNGHVANAGGLVENPISNTGRYLVLNMRTTGVSKLQLEARTGTENVYSATLSRTEKLNRGWETVIIDLEQLSTYDTDVDNSTFSMRLRVYRSGTSSPAQVVDIAYAAIVDDLNEVAELIGNHGNSVLLEDFTSGGEYYTLTEDGCTESKLGHVATSGSCTVSKICEACGVTYAEAPGHNFNIRNTSSENIAKRATATTPTYYYYRCECGEFSTETFSVGKTLNEMIDLTKTDRYKDIVSQINNGESFLYFTDPHFVTAEPNGSFAPHYEYFLDVMAAHYSDVGASFVISGGDWLNNSNTKENALQNLRDIDGRMSRLFNKNYYLVVGNHDYNYQTMTQSGAIIESQYDLSNEDINGAWYTDERYGGKSYYSFMGENTKYYVFDSGIDWYRTAGDMTDFDKVQVEWYLDQLLQNDDAHIALAPHMLYVSGSTLNAGTAKVLEISDIYNNRGTVTFNGKTYDFSAKTGRVEFLIAGHSHFDELSVHYNIPCVLVINDGVSTTYPVFDMVAVDYDARKLYTVRVGPQDNGTLATFDRVVELDVE